MHPPSVTAPQVHLDQGGVYFFKSPIRVTTQLNQELLVVFAAPSIFSCGLVLLDSEMPQKIIEGMFDNLLKKLDELGVPVASIRIKVIGQSVRRWRSVRHLESWCQSHKVSIGVMDVGKNITRNVIVDCASGRVGVSYAEGYAPDEPAFVDSGSVRLRERFLPKSVEIMVLTGSRVRRALAKQAIEERPGYRANCPINPIQIIALNDFREFLAAVVFLFDDLDQSELMTTWIHNAMKYYPSLRLCWVGKTEPRFTLPAPSFRLPNPEPHKIGEFKAALFEILPVMMPNNGKIIPFKKK